MTELTIPAAELSRLVTYASLHAGRDALLPVFTWLRFHERDGRLHVEATDRYTMIAVSSGVYAPAGFEVLIERTECAAVLSAFKARRGSTVVLNVKVADGRATFTLAEGILAAGLDLSITVTAQVGAYPKLGHIYTALAERDSEAAGGLPVFEGDYLRRLPRGSAQFKSGGPGKPVAFYGRDDEDKHRTWAVVIMPKRTDWGDFSQQWAAATVEAVAS